MPGSLGKVSPLSRVPRLLKPRLAVKKFLFVCAILGALAFAFHESDADWRGMPAPWPPKQTAESLPPPFPHGDCLLTPLARYDVQAVVLGRCRYRYDKGADIAPLDLALGWGPMSTAAAINELSITQSGRWYEYRWGSDGPPIPPEQIAENSANTHCIPATPEVWRTLRGVGRFDVVTLSGLLVEVTGRDGSKWTSSTTRSDTGAGACEILWVEQVGIRKP